jgi:hypothetical protein
MQHPTAVTLGCLPQGNWNVFTNLFLLTDLSPSRTGQKWKQIAVAAYESLSRENNSEKNEFAASVN